MSRRLLQSGGVTSLLCVVGGAKGFRVCKASAESQGDGERVAPWRKPVREMSAGTRHQPDLPAYCSTVYHHACVLRQLNGRQWNLKAGVWPPPRKLHFH